MKEIVFGITDGSWIYADGAKHKLYYEGKKFDVYISSNARETIYVICEHPKDRDLLLKFTSRDFESLNVNAIEKYINAEIAELLEKMND